MSRQVKRDKIRNLMPKLEREREPKPSRAIVYAGGNKKRELFLAYAFPTPGFLVMQRSGGREKDIDNVAEIAMDKIRYAVHRNTDVRQLTITGGGSLVIAADLRTNPLLKYGFEKFSRTQSSGKPFGTDDIMKTFSRIAAAARHSPESHPYYRVDAGTAIMQRGNLSSTSESLAVILDPGKMEYFRTRKGFEAYKKAFSDFYYSSQVYGDQEEHFPTLTQIAGGLSLGVLLNQEAVLEIGDVKRDDPSFRNAVKRGMYHVLISFSPDFLRKVRPDIDQVIDGYPPLEMATALAMGELPLRSRQIQEIVLKGPGRTRKTT